MRRPSCSPFVNPVHLTSLRVIFTVLYSVSDSDKEVFAVKWNAWSSARCSAGVVGETEYTARYAVTPKLPAFVDVLLFAARSAESGGAAEELAEK
jgi:hypothetical protein